MKLSKFYTLVVESLGFTVEKGRVLTPTGKELTIEKLPVVIPTPRNLRLENVWYYNILKENVLKRRKDLIKSINAFNININVGILYYMNQIVTIMHEGKDTSTELALIIKELNKAKGNAKVLVDDKLVDIVSSISVDDRVIEFTLKDAEDGKGIHGVFTSPFLNNIDEFLGKRPRRKDGDFLRLLVENVLESLLGVEVEDEENTDYPEARTFLTGLLYAGTTMKELEESLEIDSIYPDILITEDMIATLDKWYQDIKMVPDIGEVLDRQPKKKTKKVSIASKSVKQESSYNRTRRVSNDIEDEVPVESSDSISLQDFLGGAVDGVPAKPMPIHPQPQMRRLPPRRLPPNTIPPRPIGGVPQGYQYGYDPYAQPAVPAGAIQYQTDVYGNILYDNLGRPLIADTNPPWDVDPNVLEYPY